MATLRWCSCRCHRALRGDYEDALQRGDLERVHSIRNIEDERWAHLEDVLEALVASGCPCMNIHVLALTKYAPPLPPYKPPTKWTPESDA